MSWVGSFLVWCSRNKQINRRFIMRNLREGFTKGLIRKHFGKSALKANLNASTLAYLVVSVLVLSDSDSNGSVAEALWSVTAGDDCNVVGFNSNQQLCFHEDSNVLGRYECCLQIRCPEGTEARLCGSSDPESTTCVRCNPGTHQPSSFRSCYASSFQCQVHRECTRGSKVLHEGNSTTDTVCECNLELGYYGNWPECHRDKTCPPGFQLRFNGSCEQCPQHFHRAAGSANQCIPCSVCDEATMTIESRCTTAHDTLCSNVTIAGSTNADSGRLMGVILGIVCVAFIALVVLLLIALFRHKCIRGKGTIVQADTPSLASSISVDVPQEQKPLIAPKQHAPVGSRDVPNTDISNQIPVQHSTCASLCGLERNACGGAEELAPSISRNEHADDMQDFTSLRQADRNIEFQPGQSIAELNMADNITYEVEVERNEILRAEQNPVTNVTMNGKTNIYGRHVTINFNSEDQTPDVHIYQNETLMKIY